MANSFFKVNKGITLAPQTSDPTGTDGDMYYNSTLGKFRKYENGSWADFGGSSASDSIITGDSSTFESSLGSWVSYADAAGTQPVDGTGGSPGITVTRITASGSRLNGQASLSLSKGGVNRQGEGISLDITIPNYIKSQPCKVAFNLDSSMDYGTAFDSSDPSDVTVYFYDVTNSKMIQLSPYSFYETKRFEGYFQMPSDCANGRLILHITTTSAVGWVMYLDDVELSLASNQIVKADSDFESYTPTLTGFGTIATSGFKFKKIGDSVHIIGYWTNGTTTATLASITLPTGLRIDTTKLNRGNTTAASGHIVGNYTTNTGADNGFMVTATATNATLVYFADQFNAANQQVPANGSAIALSSQLMSMWLTVPILGFTSTNITAASANLNAPAVMRAFKNAGAVTAATTISTWTTEDKDSLSAFDSSTGVYTVKTPGDYQVNASIEVTVTSTSTIQIRKNGTVISENSPGISSTRKNISLMLPDLKVGDTVTVTSSATETIASNNTGTFFDITKLELSGRVYSTRTAYIKDVNASGTNGGTFTSGSYQTRILNTLSGDTSFVSLSSNQFTLQPGTYKIRASAPATGCFEHRAKLRNITDSTDAIIGSAELSATTSLHMIRSVVTDIISITSAKVFELQHRCTTTQNTTGFGDAAGFGDSEVYAIVEIEKVL